MKKNCLHIALLTILFGIAIILNGCSTKKNTFATRSYHNLTSRYNGFFYARESINEGTAKLDKTHIDDYDQILPVFVYGNLKEAQSISTELEKTFKKGSMVIERHSILLKGVEYCNWIDDTYILIGRSHFYKHDYFAGLEVFEYVSAQFKKENTKYEAWMWMLRTYNEMGLFTKSQGLMDVIKNDKKFPAKYDAELSAILADFYIKQADYQLGISHLTKAIALSKSKKQRTRYMYILAQLYQKQGLLKNATANYKQVIKRNPPYVMEFNARISLAKSYDIANGNSADIKKQLTKMLKDVKNIEYLDQINYALAEIYIKENNIPVAIKYLKQSIATSTNNTRQKALSNLKIADLYFDIPDYKTSESYYDSAVSLLDKNYPNYNLIVDKKNSLADLVKNLNIISNQDSLQKIAKLSDNERNALIDKIMADAIEVERKKKEEEEASQLNNNLNLNANNAGGSGDQGSGSNWYFYNQGNLSAGFSDFSKKWGVRKLEDNWRRSNKQIGFSDFDNPNPIDSLKQGKDSLDKAPKMRDKLSYLKDIPLTDSMMLASNAKIVEAYYELGGIYKEQLKNYEKAAETYDDLLKKYPKNKHELECYYQLYRIYLSMKEKEKAKKYKDILLNNYPNSEYAQIIKNPNFNLDILQSKNKAKNYYEETYNLYLACNYVQVKNNVRAVDSIVGKSDLQPKFEYLYALAVGKTQTKNDFELSLQQLILNYPKSEVTPSAQAMLDVIKAQKEAGEIKPDTIQEKELFTFDANAEQFIVIIADNKNIKISDLKTGLSNFNNEFYETSHLKTEDLVYDDKNKMIVVKAFENKTKAMLYYNQLTNHVLIKKLDKKNYKLFIVSDANYSALYVSKKLAEYEQFFTNNYSK